MTDPHTQHAQCAPALPPTAPPWWMDGETLPARVQEPAFLARGIVAFWQRVRGWLLLPLAQQDPLTCTESLLTLLAWERDITRFAGEPLALFRKRVKFAYLNARDAGEVAGFVRIFARLGIGECRVHERQAETDWDVITMEVTDSAIAANQPLMAALIQHYGRTCRRYRLQVVYTATATLRPARFGQSLQVFAASLPRTS